MPDFSLTRQMIEDFVNLSKMYKSITDQLMKMITSEEVTYPEETVVELTKLNVNAYITHDYVSGLLKISKEKADGTLELFPAEEANVVKCVRSLMESKKTLLESNISLEVH